MFEVKYNNKIKYFAHQADADNYNDYLKNGLKIIRTNGRTYYFNNGDRLIDVSMPLEKKHKYVLYSGNRIIRCDKLQRKHIQKLRQRG